MWWFLGKQLRLKLSDLFNFGTFAKIFESLALRGFSFLFEPGLLGLMLFELASGLTYQVLSNQESVAQLSFLLSLHVYLPANGTFAVS